MTTCSLTPLVLVNNYKELVRYVYIMSYYMEHELEMCVTCRIISIHPAGSLDLNGLIR